MKGKRVRLACHIELAGNISYNGHTRDISPDSIFMLCQDHFRFGKTPVRIGASGVLMMSNNSFGANYANHFRCHVTRVDSEGIVVDPHYSELTDKERDAFDKLLA